MDAAAAIQQEATEIMVFDASGTARHCSGRDTGQGGQSEPRVCQSFMEPKTVNNASEDGISMTRIYHRDRFVRSAALGGLLWKVLQPQEGISTCSEPNDRTLSTVGACVEQGFGPRTVRAATMSPMYWGRPEGNLAQAYQTAFECQVEWNGKVSERYAHLRIWGSQVMRVTVDRTQATVPVRHC